MNFFTLIFLIFCVQKFVNSRTSFNFYKKRLNVAAAVSYLNNIEDSTWTAGKNCFNNYVSREELRTHLGVSGEPITDDSEPWVGSDLYDYEDLPEFYDAREMYPHCSSISHIRDQSNCGSCWAVSTASAFSDRLCIHSDGVINVEASINHLLACETNVSKGCNGGQMENAWNYIKDYGLVTGGDFDSDGCQPYSIRPCKGVEGYYMPCSNLKAITPKCIENECTNEWYKYPSEKPFKTSVTKKMANNETDIRRELYRNGPMTVAIEVYTPLFFYKKGVFQLDDPKKYPFEGHHALRLIGWGTENKVPYWLLANSWREEWGDKGTMKFFRGKNHCGIESYVHGGIPIID